MDGESVKASHGPLNASLPNGAWVTMENYKRAAGHLGWHEQIHVRSATLIRICCTTCGSRPRYNRLRRRVWAWRKIWHCSLSMESECKPPVIISVRHQWHIVHSERLQVWQGESQKPESFHVVLDHSCAMKCDRQSQAELKWMSGKGTQEYYASQVEEQRLEWIILKRLLWHVCVCHTFTFTGIPCQLLEWS